MSPKRSGPPLQGPATVSATAKRFDVPTVADGGDNRGGPAGPAAYRPSPVRRRRRSNEELALLDDAILEVLADENPATLRGTFYRVVSAGAVDKTEAGYRLVGRQVLKLRRSGRLPYAWITDGTRWVTKPTTYADVEQMLSDAAVSYRRMLWRSQPVDVHVFTEKDAISGVILPVTDSWDVPLGVLRGYSSESFAWSVGQALKASGKPALVYQLGDHDPSGIDAWRDFADKVRGFAPEVDATFARLAVTPEQIGAWSLPTRPTKQTDTRAAGFVGGSVEVDAVPPNRLRQLVEDAITSVIDGEALRLTRIAEDSEREILQRIAGWSA